MGPSRSATGEPNSRRARTWGSPSSGDPGYAAMTPTIGVPWTSSGRNGAGGAVRRFTRIVISSGIVCDHSRTNSMTARASEPR